jgi:hypothetical protein
MAMTHPSFGDSNLALLVTEEAVRVAKQSKDVAFVGLRGGNIRIVLCPASQVVGGVLFILPLRNQKGFV